MAIDPNILRLYDPQLFASNFGDVSPEVPIIPEIPKIDPILREGRNRPDNFVTPDFNPNLLGQYVGYFNPSFPAAPGATGSPQEINDLMSSMAPTSIVGNELPFTQIGSNVQQQQQEEEFGLANLLKYSPTFRFITQGVPEILQNIRNLFQKNNQGDDQGGTFVEDTRAAIERAADEEALTTRENYRNRQNDKMTKNPKAFDKLNDGRLGR